MIIALDGPSGAGKSTVARMLAAEFALPYLDTGAMYRAAGLAVKEQGITLPLTDPERVAQICESLKIDLSNGPEGTVIWLNERDVSRQIREPEISLYASAVSAIPAVRRALVARQRKIGLARGGVMEGRDIGTKVFPETPFKFFLTAREPERARRRWKELASRGVDEPFEKVLAELHQRDVNDSSRADSPLSCDDSYIRVESDGMTATEVVTFIASRIREGSAKALDSPSHSA